MTRERRRQNNNRPDGVLRMQADFLMMTTPSCLWAADPFPHWRIDDLEACPNPCTAIWRFLFRSLALKGTFGGQDTLYPLIHRNSPFKGACKSLEYRLCHVVEICTIDEVDVQCYSTMIGK